MRLPYTYIENIYRYPLNRHKYACLLICLVSFEEHLVDATNWKQIATQIISYYSKKYTNILQHYEGRFQHIHLYSKYLTQLSEQRINETYVPFV